MDLVGRRRWAVGHRTLGCLCSLPQDNATLDQPALLCLAKLADHRVDASLPFIGVLSFITHAGSVADTPNSGCTVMHTASVIC